MPTHFFSEINGHKTAKVGNSMATFYKGWKVGSFRASILGVLKIGHRTSKVGSSRTQCWKPAIELPRSAVLGRLHDQGLGKVLKRGHRTAMVSSSVTKCAKVLKTCHRIAKVGSSKPRKKVWLELPRSAVLWALFPTSVYGRFAQVKWNYTNRLG